MKSGYYFPLIGVLACLLCTYVSFRYVLYYRGLIYSGASNQDKNWRLLRSAQILLLVASLAFAGSLVHLINLSETAMPQPATATLAPGEGSGGSMPGASQPSPTLSPLAPIVPTPSLESSPTPESVPGSGFARIGNTNTFGANVRSEPGLKYEMIAQLSDGSRVELTGETQSVDGFTWQHVRMEDGRLGWIANNFLIPER